MNSPLTGHGRLWPVGGALAALALLAGGWLTVIGPQNAEVGGLDRQTDGVRSRAADMERRLARLQTQNADLPRYQERLARAREALPGSSAMADFLRQLQSASHASGASVGGVTVGPATTATAAGVAVRALPVTLTVSGTANAQGLFLRQIQEVQPRAVLITSVNVVPKDGRSGRDDLSLGLQVFALPGGGASRPSPAPSADG
ncbi:type 4a pilus biogenesis protein PilO [Spirillospora sp. CA-253888]